MATSVLIDQGDTRSRHTVEISDEGLGQSTTFPEIVTLIMFSGTGKFQPIENSSWFHRLPF